ncbi:MAG: SDR family oxidoreductase [Alphaproteobacteria bacterium]|nr:SDR family oxidoreductase [Alphaproteobacteria bacterium]
MPDGAVIVTGASRGIGAVTAAALAARGVDVVGLSRAGTVPAGRAMVCDMADEEAIMDAIAEIAAQGPIAALVNNAGVYESQPSASVAAADFEALMRVNVTGVMVASREVYPHIRSRGGGCIVNMGSFFDKLGVVAHAAYCASKAAVGALTRCLAVEWAKDGITVLNVAPGYIETDLNRQFLADDRIRQWLAQRIPGGEVGKAEDVAKLVTALICEDLPFLTGETVYLDGGQGMNH